MMIFLLQYGSVALDAPKRQQIIQTALNLIVDAEKFSKLPNETTLNIVAPTQRSR
jgi:hypothetical protein